MISTDLILTDKKQVKARLQLKGYDGSKIDVLENLLLQNKALKNEVDVLRQKRNEVKNDQTILVEDKRKLRDTIAAKEVKLTESEATLVAALYDVPNMPDEDAPVGTCEKDNKILTEGKEYYQSTVKEYKTHWELGEKLNILDLASASKMSGSMFAMQKGLGSRLLRALIQYCFDLNDYKYTELTPPHMVTEKTLTGTGHLPKFRDEQYHCALDDAWMIPTAEVPLTAYFADKVFKESDLPQRAMAYTVCWRREAGSAGKDTRGMQRLHEFHKVELVKIVKPETVQEELQDLLKDCLAIIQNLKLQYRIVDLCTGDMGDKYARCYDIEVYAPGMKKWLEVSSAGHFTDFQARRSNIKYFDGSKNKYVYTLNGSGIATPRVWAAILETYQQSDGSIKIPDVLVSYMKTDVIK